MKVSCALKGEGLKMALITSHFKLDRDAAAYEYLIQSNNAARMSEFSV
jgi:hypothetical protein